MGRDYECGCCKVIVIRICSSSHNFYKVCVHRYPDLADQIFDCLLTAMAKVSSWIKRRFFLFVGEVNTHHEEWLGSSGTNLHCRATRDR